MIKVLLATDDSSLDTRLREAIGDSFLRVPAPGTTTDAGQFLSTVSAGSPDIAVLDAGEDAASALALAEGLTREHGASVILVTAEAGSLALPALRAGVRDLLQPDATAADLRAALDRTVELLAKTGSAPAPGAQPQPTASGRVITVASPKGGVGKTTVATNLAVGLAARAPQSVVLVDLDVHFGDVASALNLNPEFTLPDVARGPGSRDSIAVKSYLTLHETGLLVIPGSESPAAADSVTADDVVRLLQTLKAQFAFVVVDTAPGLSDHTLAVLDHTDTLVLVTSMDVPGVRGLRKELDTLADLKMVMGMQQIVLNFCDASRGLSVGDVEATIRRNVDVVVPQSNAVPLSVNQGIPLLQSGGRDPVTRQLRNVVDAVAPEPQPNGAKRSSLFARRVSRA